MAPPDRKKTEVTTIDDQEHVRAHFNVVHGKTPKVEFGVTVVVTFDKIDEVPGIVTGALAAIKEKAKENHINLYPSSDQF